MIPGPSRFGLELQDLSFFQVLEGLTEVRPAIISLSDIHSTLLMLLISSFGTCDQNLEIANFRLLRKIECRIVAVIWVSKDSLLQAKPIFEV